MSFAIRELPRAKQDKSTIFCWLEVRSPAGALAWLDAYDARIKQLVYDASSCSEAPESRDCENDVRQALFKTRRGGVYRVLFKIDGQDLYVLRVRGPGQTLVSPLEIQ